MRKPDWICVAADIFDNPKIMRAMHQGGEGAAILYLRGLGYIVHNLTDGWVPHEMPKRWGHKPRQIKALEDNCLWYPVPTIDSPPGWLIHDWQDYQISRAEWAAKSEQARKAAKSRWTSRTL